MKAYCPHWPGREYDKDGVKTRCLLTIDGVKEAYELSLVAVPAQPRAGTFKNYGPKPPEEPKAKDKTPEPVPENDDVAKDLEALSERVTRSLIFVAESEKTDGKDDVNE